MKKCLKTIKKEKNCRGEGTAQYTATEQVAVVQITFLCPSSLMEINKGKNISKVMVLPKSHTTLALEQTRSNVLNKTSTIMLSRVCIES